MSSGMKGSTVGSRVEGSLSHGGFHGVVSHGMPALVKWPETCPSHRQFDLLHASVQRMKTLIIFAVST